MIDPPMKERHFAWRYTPVEPRGMAVQEFEDRMSAEAFAWALGWNYTCIRTDDLDAQKARREEIIRMAVALYERAGKTRRDGLKAVMERLERRL